MGNDKKPNRTFAPYAVTFDDVGTLIFFYARIPNKTERNSCFMFRHWKQSGMLPDNLPFGSYQALSTIIWVELLMANSCGLFLGLVADWVTISFRSSQQISRRSFSKGGEKEGPWKVNRPSVSGDNLTSDRRLPPPCNCAWLESSTYLLSWFDRRWQLPNGLLTFASWHVYDFCVTQLSQMIGSYVCAKKKG